MKLYKLFDGLLNKYNVPTGMKGRPRGLPFGAQKDGQNIALRKRLLPPLLIVEKGSPQTIYI